MIALPLSIALAFAIPVAPPCSDLSLSSTMAEQFVCYKDAGRKVSLPGTGFNNGGLNGPACIVGVGADRLQLGTCGPSTIGRTTMMVPFSSIRAVEDDPSKAYVTIVLNVTVVRNGCLTDDCERVVDTPRPSRPATRTQPTAVALPPRQ
jgi:hypothetical protein